MSRLAPLALALLSACAAGPDYAPPSPALPEAWSGGPSSSAGELSEWWRAFKDPGLDALLDRVLAANLELKDAAARAREARALRGVEAGALLPEVSAGGLAQRQRWSRNGQFPTDGKSFDYYQAGFDAAWELDVFGGVRRRVEAADADLDAAVEDLRDVRVIVAAEAARLYVELRGLQERIEIARQNLDAQKRSADVARARLEAGQTTELDLLRAEAQVSATASIIPGLEGDARRAIHALSVLSGRDPAALAGELSARAPIPASPPEIPAGLPTELLRRRPDLRRAEREIAAATARVGAATADLYPRFFLAGNFGVNSVASSDLFTAASRAWAVGPTVQWSLFQGGRIRANIEVQNARQERAALRFERALLGALQEVEDALISRSRERLRRAELEKAVASQRRAVELAEFRYAEGLIDFLAVLDARRSLYVAQDALVLSQQATTTMAVALYKALGGGWPLE